MKGEQEDKGVLGILIGLDLLKHGLRFLQQDECLLVAFLRDEVDRAFVQLINHDGHLVLVEVEVLVVVTFKRVFNALVAPNRVGLVDRCNADVAHIRLLLLLLLPAQHL